MTNLEEPDNSSPVETSNADLPEEGNDQKAGENIDVPMISERDLVDVPSEDED